MKKVIVILCLLLLCGCNEKETINSTPVITKVNCENAYDLIKDGAVLIDVRTKEEYNEKHLDNSINISHDVILEGLDKMQLPKDNKIIVYCQSGNRSSQASKKLIKNGYTKVYDLGSINNCNK